MACSAELHPSMMFSPRCVLVMGTCGAFPMAWLVRMGAIWPKNKVRAPKDPRYLCMQTQIADCHKRGRQRGGELAPAHPCTSHKWWVLQPCLRAHRVRGNILP